MPLSNLQPSNLQPLLQLLTSGRRAELKAGVKVFPTTPAGFSRVWQGLSLNAVSDSFV